MAETGSKAGGGRIAHVIGHPIAQSRSPVIHRHWLAEHGIASDYRTLDVAPADLDRYLAGLDPAQTPGGNVTVPHKEDVARWLGEERCDAAARAIGAVNTLWFEEGPNGPRLVGGNTDAAGFAANLDAGAPGWRGCGHAVMIGAGGAARAVLHALIEAGIQEITIANRTPSRAAGLAEEFGSRLATTPEGSAPRLRAIGLDGLGEAMRGADFVVNTASLGMAGASNMAGGSGGSARAPSSRPAHLDPASFAPGAIATDIVYVPLRTPFLQAAEVAGCATMDGLGMLLHQAVPGFERWFGVRPSVTAELRAVVEATL